MILLIFGPSGIGKSYLAEAVVNKWPMNFEIGAVTTTRQPRANEETKDREFVTDIEFDALIRAGDFLLHDVYDNNRYGCRKSLESDEEIFVTNIWPTLVPDFLAETSAIPILLTSPSNDFLRERMSARGDDAETIRRRIAIAMQDQAFLQKYEDEISARGQIFEIRDDNTIDHKILPWIESNMLSS